MNDQANEVYDYLIIGAGSAGLAIGQLLEKLGKKVLLLESHIYAGGSSSYFKRDKFVFDVGATTLSGLESGRPLDIFQKLTHSHFTTRKIDPGIIYYLNGNFLERSANHQNWVNNFESFFNVKNSKAFWDKEKKLHDSAWKISNTFPYFPSLQFKHLPSYLNAQTLSSTTLIPHLLSPLSAHLSKELKENTEIERFFNEMLYITAQNTMEKTPHLLASMGLFYPEDTHYHLGGMKGFTDVLAKNLNIKYQSEVLNIDHKNNEYITTTKKDKFFSKNIISTIPVWNTYDLLVDKDILPKKYNADFFEEVKKESWSAFTLYFAVPTKKRNGLYYQIHFDKTEIKSHNIKSFFVSFSHESDSLRAPLGYQTVTISIHLKPEDFFIHKRKTESYENLKAKYQNIILEKFLNVFSYDSNEIQFLNAGTPNTFSRYTKRELGLVGGIPHDIKRIPFKLISPFTNRDSFYLLGDTIFPGQGVAATIQGALNLYNHLK